MEAIKKENRGGKRPNAGAKKKYGSTTSTVCFRVPDTHREQIVGIVRAYLDKLKHDYKQKQHEQHYGC